ncbi:GNAT family N-acetyltransferase [Sphingomonas koreensis]|nr:aminoglycoside 6'-N-acetyltransferase [Sphingomonas koreensis]MDC7811473.1 GNAT family N-acetyltransferase [Sphingomonas koreensis]
MLLEIVTAGAAHKEAWASLREALWPEGSRDEHATEIVEFIAEMAEGREQICFLAIRGDEALGFAEAAIRHDYVNGCDTSPVAFLEGIYVAPPSRRAGVAGALLAAVEAWGRHGGCTELGSDAALTNVQSHAFHRGLGFEETERVVYFRKAIEQQG